MNHLAGYFNFAGRVWDKRVPVLPELIMLVLWTTSAAHSPQVSLWDFVPSQELNNRLPNWLSFSGEFRARAEAVTGIGFRDGSDDDYLLSRLRINMTVKAADWLKFQFGGQDDRAVWNRRIPAAPPYEQTMNLRIAYLELGDTEKKTFGLRVGREEILLGDQRLVGNSNWLDVPRVFDVVRLTLRHKGYRLDAFAANPVQPVNGEFDRPFRQKADNFYGMYGGFEKIVPHAVVEPYVFWRVTRNLLTEFSRPGNRDSKTLGVRWVGTLPSNFDYQLETALQRGSLGSDRIAAWAGHWLLDHSLAAARKARVFVEYNFSSGDRNPRDGVEGTFDQLYPTGHDRYGLADQVGWRNIEDARAGAELHPRKGWLVAVSYHSYWLASATDALYGANGMPIVRQADGSAGRRIGQEGDVSVLYNLNRQIQLGVGFAHLFPGQFLRSTTSARPQLPILDGDLWFLVI